ncbi:hypothetical protein Cpir12675_006772 [Ceratocystis pirilliformis]|uniref:Uncharacterized protein n=1 Tax=Ceratocystis pirilliformis TaxID=259994 RepID=A0ABR3YGB1_9PEZI
MILKRAFFWPDSHPSLDLGLDLPTASIIDRATSSSSETLVGWTSNPDTRGTASIIYTCIAVLLLCSYNCLHENIRPSICLHTPPRTLWGIPVFPHRLAVSAFWSKLTKTLWLALLPESGVAVATVEYSMARQTLHDVRCSHASHRPWYKFHYNQIHTNTPPWSEDELKTGLRNEITIAHAFYADMGGFVRINAVGDEKLRDRPADGWPVDLHQYVMFLRLSSPETRKRYLLRQGDIEGFAKADGFSKILALIQSAWLIISCIGRHATGLPITPLELASAAYVVCAAFMYGLWWDKPYGAVQRTVLHDFDDGMARAIAARCAEAPSDTAPMREPAIDPGDTYESAINLLTWNVVGVANFKDRAVQPLLFYIVSMLFGGVHLLAWNWVFPNDSVMEAWRAFSLVCTLTPVLVTLTSALLLARFGFVRSLASPCDLQNVVLVSIYAFF